jgi:hypothetical protein
MFKITIQALPLTAEFEVGSIGEAIGILEEQNTHLLKMLGLSSSLQAVAAAAETTAISSGTVHIEAVNGAVAEDTSADDAGTDAAETNGATTKRRGRKSNAEKEAEAKAAADAARLAEEAAAKAAAATAPEPIAIPGAAPDTTVGSNGVPAFLDRTAAQPQEQRSTAAAPPPPPPAAAPPPPPAPVAPPSGILAGKVIANLNLRKSGAGEDEATKAAVGKQLADWLASENVALVAAGSSFDDAVDAIRLMSDERLTPIAKSLEVA